ncbi:hypothetical protein [Chitinimonas lacunae]|uniref:DUF1329 domain-containing protein n=1 Tax=Chitinimonas lacunae TaxID=1963018 RepID=A0ABV8MVW4_9NEIS
MKTNRLTLIALCVATLGVAHAESELSEESIRAFMERFHRDPATVMDQLPEKSGAGAARFSASDVENRVYVDQKTAMRDWMVGNSQPPGNAAQIAPIHYGNDNPARLVDNGAQIVSNVHTIDSANLRSARLTAQPWSDTYWPLYNGSLSNRYADARQWNYPTATWKDYWNFAHQIFPITTYVGAQMNLLSPAEKYDLLVGDVGYNLTVQMWNSGKRYYDAYGKVEAWMGLCHGWAAASYTLPRPKKSLELTGVNGHKMTFYPSDIKALGTLLWSNASPGVRFVGGRCNTKNPAKDANGRIIDQYCFDSNPGSWHQAVINQIGISKRSFIFDATYDYEVWNQPVLGYSLVYFNPQTNQTFATARQAMIARSAYTSDKFKNYRDQNGQYIVGVRMRIDYMNENSPSHRTTDSPAYDSISAVTYTYDLELDAAGKILGGEWYSNRHPDFMWTPAPNARAISYYNPYYNWTAGTPLPAGYKAYAPYTSRYSQPITNIVEQLFRWASQ